MLKSAPVCCILCIGCSAVFGSCFDQAHFFAATATRREVSSRFSTSDSDKDFRAAVSIRAAVVFPLVRASETSFAELQRASFFDLVVSGLKLEPRID